RVLFRSKHYFHHTHHIFHYWKSHLESGLYERTRPTSFCSKRFRSLSNDSYHMGKSDIMDSHFPGNWTHMGNHRRILQSTENKIKYNRRANVSTIRYISFFWKKPTTENSLHTRQPHGKDCFFLCTS